MNQQQPPPPLPFLPVSLLVFLSVCGVDCFSWTPVSAAFKSTLKKVTIKHNDSGCGHGQRKRQADILWTLKLLTFHLEYFGIFSLLSQGTHLQHFHR